MNKFRNLFRPKRKESEKLDRLAATFSGKENDENEKPRTSREDPRIDPTACYHTNVAPKNRRGPKSLPGGTGSYDPEAHNCSFDARTEVPTRRRARSPDYCRDSQRHKRSGQRQRDFQSEYGGHDVSLAKSHFTYRTRYEEDTYSEDENDEISHMKRQISELKQKLSYSVGRHSFYKHEWKATTKQHHIVVVQLEHEKKLLAKELELAKQEIQSLRAQQQQAQFPPFSHFGSYYPFQQQSSPFASASNKTGSSIVADPQPTRNDIVPYDLDDGRDEQKVYRRDSSSTMTDEHATMSDLNQAINDF